MRTKLVTAIAVLLTGVLAAASISRAAEWSESMKVKGDVRYRHEMIDKQGNDARHRQRIRARLGVFGEVSPYTQFGIQLASGSSDPVSTNQTLDGAFSTKSIGLDLAYFTTGFKGVEGFKVVGGKMKNPFYKPGKSELVWDGDVNPEGGAAVFTREVENFAVSVVGSGFWIDERSSGDDTYLAAGQATGRFYFNDKKSNLVFGAGFYNFANTRGYDLIYDSGDAFGNSAAVVVSGTDTTFVYANDYEILEMFGEFNHKFEKFPMTVMGHFVTNTGADSLETGMSFGLRLGKARKTGSWEFRYSYKKVERDAVVGVFTDSDFGGGGTDIQGHEFGGGIALAKNTAVQVTYFINELDLEAAQQDDYNRLQLDLQLKF